MEQDEHDEMQIYQLEKELADKKGALDNAKFKYE